jgi:hypothetical protein
MYRGAPMTDENKPVLSDFGVAKSVQSADAQLTRHASASL